MLIATLGWANLTVYVKPPRKGLDPDPDSRDISIPTILFGSGSICFGLFFTGIKFIWLFSLFLKTNFATTHIKPSFLLLELWL